MAKLKKSVVIGAPVEQVYDYLRDPMSNLEWLPGMMEIKQLAGEGVGARFRWVYKMAGIGRKGETTALEFIPNERMVTQSKGGIASTWTWTFEPEDRGTMVDLEVEYMVPIPVLGKLAEALVLRQNERELDVALANIKARVES